MRKTIRGFESYPLRHLRINIMSKWKLMTDPPDAPIMVEFFAGNAGPIKDQDGKEYAHDSLRDMRRSLGYWDGKDFCEQGTNHTIDDSMGYDPDWYPTHYRPLPTVQEVK